MADFEPKNQKNFLDSKQEANMLAPAVTFKSGKLRVRQISRIQGTCLYLFDYRSSRAHEPTPLVMLVGRAAGGPYFRYPPPATRAKGDTYLAAIVLNDLPVSTRKYLLNKFGRMSYIPTGEAKKLGILNIIYRIYDTRKIRNLYPVDVNIYSQLL